MKKKKTSSFKPGKNPVRVWRPARTEPVHAATTRVGSSESGDVTEVLPKNWEEMRSFVDDLREKIEAKDKESLFGVFKDTLRTAKNEIKDRLNADRALMGAMAATLELAASRYALDPGEQWEPGKPLKLLLAGYSGTRNTGADVRVGK